MRQTQDLQPQKPLKDFNVLGIKLSQQGCKSPATLNHPPQTLLLQHKNALFFFFIKYVSGAVFLLFEINPMEMLQTQAEG